MSRPEIWVREGRDLEISPQPDQGIAYVRLTDKNSQITLRYTLTTKDLRDLRRWLTKVLK